MDYNMFVCIFLSMIPIKSIEPYTKNVSPYFALFADSHVTLVRQTACMFVTAALKMQLALGGLVAFAPCASCEAGASRTLSDLNTGTVITHNHSLC